jgi:hypothetical protein
MNDERQSSDGRAIQSALFVVLSDFGCDIEIAAPGELRFQVAAPSERKWRSQAICHEREDFILIYYYHDQTYPSNWTQWVLEAVAELNSTVVTGCFVFERGCVIYRMSSSTEHARLFRPALTGLLNQSALGLDLCERTFARLGQKGISARDAVALAKIEAGIAERHPRLSKAAVKSTLRVDDGGYLLKEHRQESPQAP